ncbi:coiled-coil domain-containing protein 43-like [Teleopsis dalmanni]|uniref:coiled-coil domain-containing protein 43-like n=1 Tax=Teleopsis dalmanni TaxID=139649 RepID=UPI0018CFAD51|nr:coiled-coil domain-containing protein 43-like [Teleopsis dalmanni]
MVKGRVKFKKWLFEKLREWEADEVIFGNYIIDMLESDGPEDEKVEILQDLLSAILSEDATNWVSAVLQKFDELGLKEKETLKPFVTEVNGRVPKLLETQKVHMAPEKWKYTKLEQSIRDEIVSRYSSNTVVKTDKLQARRTRALTSVFSDGTEFYDVAQLQKERREEARLAREAQEAKQPDEREVLKQLRQQRNEKRRMERKARLKL